MKSKPKCFHIGILLENFVPLPIPSIINAFIFLHFQILEVGDDWRKLYPPLKLHETWIRDIRFNRDDPFALVTSGDRIAWWNLDLLPSLRGKKATPTSGGTTSGRRRMSSSGAGIFT